MRLCVWGGGVVCWWWWGEQGLDSLGEGGGKLLKGLGRDGIPGGSVVVETVMRFKDSKDKMIRR